MPPIQAAAVVHKARKLDAVDARERGIYVPRRLHHQHTNGEKVRLRKLCPPCGGAPSYVGGHLFCKRMHASPFI